VGWTWDPDKSAANHPFFPSGAEVATSDEGEAKRSGQQSCHFRVRQPTVSRRWAVR